MNLDELRSIQSKERQKDSLQNLRPSFYQEVGEYIATLETERDRVADQTDDPFSSPEVGRLTDEIETAKDVVEAVYERRMGKLVKQASLAAAGMPANDEGLTAEEGALFDDLVDRISSNKTRVLDVLEGGEDTTADESEPETAPHSAGEPGDRSSTAGNSSSSSASADNAPTPPPDRPPAEVSPTADDLTETGDSSGVSPADVMGGNGSKIGDTDVDRVGQNVDPDSSKSREPTPSESGHGTTDEGDPDGTEGSSADVDRTTVRITSDIGSILGVDDREYTLASDDVVMLPEQNAAPLLDREAAERLE